MKKTLSLILFIVSVAVLLFDIYYCVYGIVDIHKKMVELAATPGTSGVDYFGIGWGYGICSFFISLFGVILSSIGVKVSSNKIVRYCLYGTIVLFILSLIGAVMVFYL